MRLSIFIGLFFLSVLAFSADIAELEKYFEQENLQQLKNVLTSHATLPADDPSILFFRGFVEENPVVAVSYYQRLVNDFPRAKYADYALFRLGQYSYFIADYGQARRYFSRLILHYPQSELRDDAQYLYCQCIMAAGKTDSAKLFLKAFVQNVKRSPYVDAAILDLESLGGLSQQTLAPSTKEKKSPVYTIQVASYRNQADAQTAIHKLARVFPNVSLGERTLGNTTYYLIFVGKFESKDKAAAYAKLYIAPHLSEYKIVEQAL